MPASIGIRSTPMCKHASEKHKESCEPRVDGSDKSGANTCEECRGDLTIASECAWKSLLLGEHSTKKLHASPHSRPLGELGLEKATAAGSVAEHCSVK